MCQLLTDFESYVDGAYGNETWHARGQLNAVHAHFGQVDAHLFNKVVLRGEWVLQELVELWVVLLLLHLHIGGFFRFIFALASLLECGLLLLLGQCLVFNGDAEDLLEVDFQEVEHRWSMYLVVNGL